MELCGAVSFAVTVHNFYNVDLYQRGYYQVRCFVQPPNHCSTIAEKTEVSLPPRKAAQLFSPSIVDGGFVGQTFEIVYQDEEIELNDSASFKATFPLSLEKPPSVFEFPLSVELWFVDKDKLLSSDSVSSTIPTNDRFACVSRRQLLAQFPLSHGLHASRAVLFEYASLSAVTISVSASLTALLMHSVVTASGSTPDVKRRTRNASPTQPSSTSSSPALTPSQSNGNVATVRRTSQADNLLPPVMADAPAHYWRATVFGKIRIKLIDCKKKLEILSNNVSRNTSSESEALASVESDMQLLSGELRGLWLQFVDMFAHASRAAREVVHPALRREMHHQRVKRFSEGFFVSETPIQSLSSYSTSTGAPVDQLQARIADEFRRSQYASLAPPLGLYCASLDGRPSTMPIVFEERFFPAPCQTPPGGVLDRLASFELPADKREKFQAAASIEICPTSPTSTDPPPGEQHKRWRHSRLSQSNSLGAEHAKAAIKRRTNRILNKLAFRRRASLDLSPRSLAGQEGAENCAGLEYRSINGLVLDDDPASASGRGSASSAISRLCARAKRAHQTRFYLDKRNSAPLGGMDLETAQEAVEEQHSWQSNPRAMHGSMPSLDDTQPSVPVQSEKTSKPERADSDPCLSCDKLGGPIIVPPCSPPAVVPHPATPTRPTATTTLAVPPPRTDESPSSDNDEASPRLSVMVDDNLIKFVQSREDFKTYLTSLGFGGALRSELAMQTSCLPYFSYEDEYVSSEMNGHLIVCVHGLDGTSFDLRMVRAYLEIGLNDEDVEFLMSEANEEDTFTDFETMSYNLVDEVLSHLNKAAVKPKRISAVADPRFEPWLPCLYTFLSLNGPHCGVVYTTSSLVNMGIWLVQRWNKSLSLQQLALKDSADIRSTFLYELSRKQGLQHFKHVLLVGSYQDHYVPLHSAHISLCKSALRDSATLGHAYTEMVMNLLHPLIAAGRTTVVRYTCFHCLPAASTNSLIGRAAHIAVLDSDLFIEKLMLVSALSYFK